MKRSGYEWLALGSSARSYNFELFPLSEPFDDESAVYIFAKQSITIEPLYIGESGELGTRLASHEKWPCVEAHGCTHIGVHWITGEENRRNAETDLIRKYNPPCND